MEVAITIKNRDTIWSYSPLLDIYSQKNIVWKNTCTPVFTAALSTTAKTWKLCLSIEEMSIDRGTDKEVRAHINIYNGILMSH